MPFIALAIVAALAIGGGATIASNSSAPGDMLYGLKIGVHEKLETALSLSDESRAEEHLEAIAERHAEAKKLGSQGRLTAETKANLNANIDAHAEAFTKALANVKTYGSAEAVAQLEAKLQASLDAATQANASADVDTDVDANANSNANVNSNSQGSATGTMNSASTSGKGGIKIEVNSTSQVQL